MAKQLEKLYDPSAFEDRIYKEWEERGYFHAAPNPEKKPFTIAMPPPNITGQLHIGHALDGTTQDVIIRYKRMCGYEALWQPGTDHAAIATEARVVAALAEKGETKESLGREEFLRRCWEWKDKYSNRIVEQFKKLGCSADWSRLRFTMDDGCSRAVNTVFERLYNEGLIYRGERMINWCPHCRTSLSDAEVEHNEHNDFFYHLRYPFADGSGWLELATTRPETMFGDTAVAVHPDDERYKAIVGKMLHLPLTGRDIPVIADSFVDMEFGTAAVKVTPAHDPNDFEAGLRNHLPVIKVINDDGTMNENAGKYAGTDRFACRKALVKELEETGFLVRTEPITHNVGECYRCHTIVEPAVSTQWFVKMEPLAEPALEAVRSGETTFVPERFDKVYYHWMENIRDWCISRQLWWGHRIPAYYCDKCGKITVSASPVEKCPACGGEVHQDPDTLDTWFSSALWPFSTLGWPDKDPCLDYFYPTSVLVTAYDIIFFWVARMIFSGIHYTGKSPFSQVLIHGLVRDAQGRKMSKSLGNGVDPLEMIAKYGTDPLRFSLLNGTSPGLDSRMSEDRIESARNFCNKIWNAARFVLMNLDGLEDAVAPDSLPEKLEPEDKWILTRYTRTAADVRALLDRYELGMAVGRLYDFIWDEFCDWYVELTKERLYAGGEGKKQAVQVLCYVFGNTLKLLHPFMPFITEEIWQSLPHTGESIMISDYPEADPKLDFGAEADEVETVMLAVRAIRNRRAEMNVAPSRKTTLHIESPELGKYLACARFFVRLAGCTEVLEGRTDGVSIMTDDARMTIPLAELVDVAAEKARLEKERAGAQKELAGIDAKLANPGFLAKAPEAVVAEQRERGEKLRARIEAIAATLAEFNA